MGIRSGVTLGLGAARGAEGTGTALGRLDPSHGSRCRWNEGTLVQQRLGAVSALVLVECFVIPGHPTSPSINP